MLMYSKAFVCVCSRLLHAFCWLSVVHLQRGPSPSLKFHSALLRCGPPWVSFSQTPFSIQHPIRRHSSARHLPAQEPASPHAPTQQTADRFLSLTHPQDSEFPLFFIFSFIYVIRTLTRGQQACLVCPEADEKERNCKFIEKVE